MKDKKYKSFLRNFYLSTALYDFIFAYAIYTLLFSVRGLSISQIAALVAWWTFTALIFEIPSGALADYWSRKKMLVLAPLIKAVCFVLWFFADGNFYIYALGFLFWSMASSFVSGTSQALLYDELSAFNKKEDYEKALGRRDFYFYLSIGISVVIGGIIANYNLDWAIIFSVIPLFLSSFFALLIKETPKVKSTEEINYLHYFKIALKEVKSSKTLRLLFIYSLGLGIFWEIEEFDQLYFKLAGLPVYAFGIVGLLWSLAEAFGAKYAYKFKKYNWIFYIFPLLSSISLFAVAFYANIPIIGFLILSYFLVSPLYTLIESKIQHNISSISRATVSSIKEMAMNFVGIFMVIFFGIISKFWDLQAIYLSAAIFLLLFSGWVYFKKHSIHNK